MKKKILLITPILFHYHEVLIKEFEKKNFDVVYFPDQPQGALTALKRKLLPNISSVYYSKILKKIKEEKFDYFLLINGKGITIDFLKRFRKENPKSKFITYQWDSLARNNLERKTNYLYLLDYFDKCYTFDYKDSLNIEKLNYLPNFHTIENQKNDCEKKVDIFIVGSYTKERYLFLKEYESILKANDFIFYHYLYMPWHHFARELFIRQNFINPKYLKFSVLQKEKLEELYKKSKATVDIAYKNQSGFTMRIMEAIAYKCKIYTTNTLIKNEDFYKKNNIVFINETNFFDMFIENQSKPTSSSVHLIENLHIKNWINKILS